MPRTAPALAATALALTLGACVSPGANGPSSPLVSAVAPGAVVPAAAPPPGAKWSMPWQLDLASKASEAQGERTYVALVENYGPVRGTQRALTYVNYPLDSISTARPGRNRTVSACRDVVAGEATSKGATKVEAVSYGPDRRVRGGYEGPVAFRIFYRKSDGLEVRQSLLDCKVDRRGKIVDAFVPPANDPTLAYAGPRGTYASLR